MENLQRHAKPVAIPLVFVLLFFSAMWAPAQAALVGTGQLQAQSDSEATRAQLHRLVAREDVRRQLASWGIDPAEAQARIDNLTEAELAEFSRRMGDAPAGSGKLAVVAVVSLIVFLVLLCTDILGYTDIFPFVK
jgi:hypothetical protein